MPRKAKKPSVRTAFAARLEAIRLQAGYDSMAAFAAQLGLEAETYRRYERSETEPNITVLVRLSELTGLSLDYIVAGRVSPSQTPAHARAS